MLTIRNEQMDEFRVDARNQFIAKLMPLVRKDCGAAVEDLDDEELRKRIVFAVDQAQQRELTWESSVYVYVTLSILIGPRFDLHPLVKALLEDAELAPNERVAALPGKLPDEVWRSAGQDSCGDWAKIAET